MKKLLLLLFVLLTLLVSAPKAKAWCVLCYHPHHGAAEQLMDEENHHRDIPTPGPDFYVDYDHDRVSNIHRDYLIYTEKGDYNNLIVLYEGETYHFRSLIDNEKWYYYINGKLLKNESDWKEAYNGSEEYVDYDHNRTMNETHMYIWGDEGSRQEGVLLLKQGEVHHFKTLMDNSTCCSYVDGIKLKRSDYKEAYNGSEECE